MEYAVDVLIILLLFSVFSYVHSFLASIKVKQWFKITFGELIAFYRLAYNLFSLFSFYIIYLLSPKSKLVIYDLSNPYDLIVLIPQLLALAGIFWAFRYICFKEFLGLDQIKRFLAKSYNTELDEELTLQIAGPFKYSRHPLYFFSIVFLLFRPTMDLFYLTFFLCVVAYFYIGSYYEERKLVKYFGEIYTTYQKIVPRIFPVKFWKPFLQEEFAEN
jgi:protein-S-isoprenylcysteine O-methyltransferase Ste14